MGTVPTYIHAHTKLHLISKAQNYRVFILPYIQNPTPTMIAKTMRPIIIGATKLIRKIMIAIITINAIIPTIIPPSVPAKPKINHLICSWETNRILEGNTIRILKEIQHLCDHSKEIIIASE